MTGWQAVRTLIAFELKREWIGAVATMLFAGYFGFVFAGLQTPDGEGVDNVVFLTAMRDWIYLFGLPLYGCLMNRTIFAYWKQDPFTKRIAHWRTMPIPPGAIVKARYAQAIVLIALAGSLFMGIPFLIDASVIDPKTQLEWLSVGMIWICYGIIVQTGHIHLELGFSGKTFVLWYMGFCLALGALSTVLAWQRVSLFREVQRLAEEQPIVAPLIALAVAVLAIGFGIGRTARRMTRRSFTF